MTESIVRDGFRKREKVIRKSRGKQVRNVKEISQICEINVTHSNDRKRCHTLIFLLRVERQITLSLSEKLFSITSLSFFFSFFFSLLYSTRRTMYL